MMRRLRHLREDGLNITTFPESYRIGKERRKTDDHGLCKICPIDLQGKTLNL